MPSFTDIVNFILDPNASRILILVLLAYLILLWIALIIWVTKDIISRTNNIPFQIFSILLVVVLNVFGVILYAAIRPSKTLIDKFFEDLEYEALVDATKRSKKPMPKNKGKAKKEII